MSTAELRSGFSSGKARRPGSRLPLLAAISLLAAAPAWAGGFVDQGDGTVVDTGTGLMWQKCLAGQWWINKQCLGGGFQVNFQQARELKLSYAGHDDWRLPNIRELQTLIDREAQGPAIDTAMFPGTPAAGFWSSTPWTSNYNFDEQLGYAWTVHFQYGLSYPDHTAGGFWVRMVRGGEASSALLDPARPDADYVDHGDGTVTHTPTGLMWQKCSLGQTWDGSSCAGTASALTFEAASAQIQPFAGYGDWRVPSEGELASLVDYAANNPAINGKFFPATPLARFWSASPVGYMPTYAWDVVFDSGALLGDEQTNTAHVRLVRGGKAAAFSASGALAGNTHLSLVAHWEIDPADAGQTGNYYVARFDGSLLHFLTPGGWETWQGGPLPVFATGVLQNREAAILDNADVSQSTGHTFYAGYGRDDADLLSGKFGTIYTLSPPATILLNIEIINNEILEIPFPLYEPIGDVITMINHYANVHPRVSELYYQDSQRLDPTKNMDYYVRMEGFQPYDRFELVWILN